jgi:hypothetical protein
MQSRQQGQQTGGGLGADDTYGSSGQTGGAQSGGYGDDSYGSTQGTGGGLGSSDTYGSSGQSGGAQSGGYGGGLGRVKCNVSQ